MNVILIDGYNLLNVSGILGRGVGPGGLQRSRLALLNFLAESLEPKELARTTVVFDSNDTPTGLPRAIEHRGISVQFAAKYESADELIEELIAANSAPRRLTVVSSDHRIQRAAGRRRAKAVDSDVWYVEMLRRRQERRSTATAPARPAVPLLQEDVEYWIRQFGGESVLTEFLNRELGWLDSPEPEQAEHEEETKPATPKNSGRSAKQAESAGTVKTTKKTPKRRRKQTESDKPPAKGLGDLNNPFPPGYGEDLLEDL